jgi:hypothetical protein
MNNITKPLIGLLTIWMLTEATVSHASNLIMRLTATEKSFVEGEPVFVQMTIENKGTNATVIVFGRRMLENLVIWTDSDLSKKQSKRLKGGGIHAAHTAITLGPTMKYKELLLVDEWLTLRRGNQTLNVAIKWAEGEIVSSTQVVISPDTDGALEKALKVLLAKDAVATNHIMEDLYRRGLKEACNRTKGKAALINIRDGMSPNDLAREIVEEVLKNYDKGISD